MVDCHLEIGHRWTSIDNINYVLLFYMPPNVIYGHHIGYDREEIEW